MSWFFLSLPRGKMTTTQAATQDIHVIDKRYFPRWEVENRVLFQLKDNAEVFEGYTKDLNCAGMCLNTPQLLTVHQKLKLIIYLSKKTSISLLGIIVWVRDEKLFHKAGVVFYNTPMETQDIMLQFAFNLNKERLFNDILKDSSD